MFWMDVGNDQLYRSFLNGSQMEMLLSSGIQNSGDTVTLHSVPANSCIVLICMFVQRVWHGTG